jgi:hypothetical protein
MFSPFVVRIRSFNYRLSLIQKNGIVDIVASRAGQCIKINTLAFKPGVFLFLLAVAAVTGGRLLILVSERVGFDMDLVACGAIDRSFIVHTANKANPFGACVCIRMTGQAGMDLFFPGRDVLTASERGQRRETAAAMRP